MTNDQTTLGHLEPDKGGPNHMKVPGRGKGKSTAGMHMYLVNMMKDYKKVIVEPKPRGAVPLGFYKTKRKR